MTTYQDVVTASLPLAAWALTEAGGIDFAPYISAQHLTGSGVFDYRQIGPAGTDFSLNFRVGAKAGFTFTLTVVPPFTTEGWFKFVALPLASNSFLFYQGAQASNGVGLYVKTDGHIHLLQGGIRDTDTGVIWPDTNWHLVELISAGDGTTRGLAFDGVIRYRASQGGGNTPAPNQLNYCGDSAGGAAVATRVAWPAIYAYEMSAANVASIFGGVTNPSGALGGTVSGGGGVSGSNSALLNLILQSVRKTYVAP